MSPDSAPESPITCVKCGASLGGTVTHGLCPVCLMDEVMAPTGGQGRWEAPSAGELAAMLPQYEIEDLLGRGGMGAVYQGRQVELDRRVAIKILPANLGSDGQDYAARFKLEARAMARLKHPGIVTVYDFGQTAEGLLYFVMEFVEGMDVHAMIAREGRLHSANAIAIAAHVCEALHYAHSHGIVHRDIKPANVIVGYDGQVRVADFGLAKVMNTSATSPLTLSGTVMGTPNYLAPEALLFGTEVDHRADLYAVGVMLYHMLTGRVPYGAFEMPSFQIPGLDPRLDTIVAKAMREDPGLRYQTAEALRQDLVGILTQPVAQTVLVPAKSAAAPQHRSVVPVKAVKAKGIPGDSEDCDPATARAMLDTTRSLNTTLLVLGTTALLILAALVFFLANRKTGDVFYTEQTVTTSETNNTYFTQIIAAGLATAEDLRIIAEIRPYERGFIGVTGEGRSWREAQDLAEKAGAEVLEIDGADAEARIRLLAWLTTSYGGYLSSEAWVREHDEARVVRGLEVLAVGDGERPRRTLLHWNLEEQSTTRVETVSTTSVTPITPAPNVEASPGNPAAAPKEEESPLPEWRSRDGRVIRGEFIELSGESVVIRREDGQVFPVPFSTLSPASIEQAMRLGRESK
ncbi:MAG: serine/threonine protein kinase [Verrucomicrobiae bacterium]|nr:serine/threonine protein kinase [Verrucomicrobiae bacterium]